MKKIKYLIEKNKFLKSILLVAGGTAFAQAINTLMSPIVTRIYTPEEYGILTIYISIIGLFSVIGSFRYEYTIPIVDDDKIAINMIGVSIITLILNTLIGVILMFTLGDVILNLLQASTLYKYRLLIPIGLFFIGMYNILSQWAYRKQDFKTLSKTKVKQTIVDNTIKLFGGIINLGPITLIVGKILGQSAGFINLSQSIIKEKNLLKKSISKEEMIYGIKRYIKFPLFSMPSQFLNTAGIQLPTLFLTAFFGSQVIGLYGLANSIINLPFSLIGGSISDVYYSEAANIGKSNPKKLKILSQRLLKKLIVIGIIPTMIVVIWGPNLFSIVFGNEWYESGVYARIIVILIFSRFIFMPISRVYEVYERQKEAFIIDFTRIILVISVFIISKMFGLSSYYTMFLYSISMTFIYLNTYLMSQKILNEEIIKLNIIDESNIVEV